MDLIYNKKTFIVNSEDNIEYTKELDNGNKIYFNVILLSEKFKEYQKKTFIEFYSDILEIEENTSNFLDFKKQLEDKIKQFNTHLKIFQEKISIDNKIEIKWNLQIFYNNNYLSVLIWETSNIIFRNSKLEVVIPNEVEEDDKIDIFSEIIEWELENQDKIISIGCNIYNYLDNSEIKDLILNDDIVNNLLEILSVRIEKQEIWYIIFEEVKFNKVIITNKKNDYFLKAKKKIIDYKYPIWIILWVWVILFLIIAIFSYIWGNNKQTINIWGNTISNNIDWLKRQIDAFSKLDNTNSTSAKQQYKEIMSELNEYQKNNIQVLEIKELKKQMEKNYYKWFHINIVWKNDWLLNLIYTINSKVEKKLSWVNTLISTNNTFSIVGNKWVMLNMIDNNSNWIYQKIWNPSDIKICSKNLWWNWIYCYTNSDNIYNISKYWLNAVVNPSNTWWKDILSLWIYGTNKLYTLNQKWVIKRYVLVWWNKFWNATSYKFVQKWSSKFVESLFSWSTLAIDGTFLIWSKEWLLQAWRKSPYTNDLYIRQVSGWKKWVINQEKDFKWKVKIISNKYSKYIYLYDYNTQSLVVYLTSPYKTNSSATSSYNLIYKYKIKFDILNEIVKDVVIKENTSTNKKYVYILTNKSIYKMDLDQFNE